jgi:hypothetical protein
MLTTQWRHLLRRMPRNPPTSARRSTARWRKAVAESAAEVVEVLENRAMLTTSLVFALQPGNAIAGHDLTSFTVDVVNSGRHVRGTPNIDTSYTGLCFITANGPGVLVTPTYPAFPNGPGGVALQNFVVFINGGIGKYSGGLAAIDVAGMYTLTVTSPASGPTAPFEINNPGVPGNAVSNSFTISPDKSSDHLVFLNGPYLIGANVPFNVPVAMEDQFGNIDTSISKATAYLEVIGSNGFGATYMAEFSAGQATFTNVTLPAAPPSTDPVSEDTLLALAFAGPNGFAAASTPAVVVSPTSGG